MDELFELIGELPDVWDVMVGVWEDDSLPSRFGHEAWTEEHFRGIKQLTSKPVVGIGWLTSPDTMVRLVRDGVLDLIGAARPSIADPFLPAEDRGGAARGHPRVHRLQRLRHRRLDDDADPLHPEPVDGRGVAARLAPRALPAARLGREGAGRRRRPGRARGRDGARQARLRGDARRGDARARRARARARRGCPGSPPGSASSTTAAASSAKLPNVEIALESEVTADEVREYGFDHVAVATGARWRADGVGRRHTRPIPLDRRRRADARRPLRRRAPERRARRPLRRRPLLPRRRARRAARRRGEAA